MFDAFHASAFFRRARYLDWVLRNREFVRKRCGAAVGYVHMADMEERGFEDFSRGAARARLD
eukprot:6200350-Pleurochrysis_carterae.AAC.1